MQKRFRNNIFTETGSTNREAARLASSVTLPHMVAAAAQSGGRGRHGKSFFSEGGIYFSMILDAAAVKIPPLLLTTAAACATLRAIEAEYDAEPKIKWINDIYLGEKKVCGILTEAQSDLETGTFSHYIVGIGINAGGDNFPPEVEDIACSLDPASVRKTDFAPPLRTICLLSSRQSLRILCGSRAKKAVCSEEKSAFSAGRKAQARLPLSVKTANLSSRRQRAG